MLIIRVAIWLIFQIMLSLSLPRLLMCSQCDLYADGIVSSAVNGDGDTITLTFDEVIGTSVTGKDIPIDIMESVIRLTSSIAEQTPRHWW